MDTTNNVNVNNATENTQKPTALKLDIEPINFNSTADVVITTTNELGKLINDIFGGVFNDYNGCTLDVQFQPNLQSFIVVPNLVFRVLPKEAYKQNGYFAFIPFDVQQRGTNDLIERVKKLSLMSNTNGIKVDITNDGKSALEDFLLPGVKKPENDKFNWGEIFTPMVVNNETFVRVYKLDICTILKKIYGDRVPGDKNGKFYYQITPTYKINATAQYKQRDNWAINILRLNTVNMNKGLSDLGYGAPVDQGFANVITDRS